MRNRFRGDKLNLNLVGGAVSDGRFAPEIQRLTRIDLSKRTAVL